MLCVLPGQLMGEVFVTVPFAKPIPKLQILYHSSHKKTRPSWYFCNACLISLKKTQMCIIIKQMNDLKTVTYDSFAPNTDVSTR